MKHFIAEIRNKRNIRIGIFAVIAISLISPTAVFLIKKYEWMESRSTTPHSAAKTVGDAILPEKISLPAKKKIGSAPQKHPNDSSATKSLPPPETPLAGIYRELLARSKSGDAAAAMRLYSDLATCKKRDDRIRQMNHFSFMAKSVAGSSGNIVNPDSVDKNLKSLDATDKLCKDIDQNMIERRGEQLRQAALSGDTEAMVCYSMSTLEAGPKYLSDAWFDYASRWAAEAPSFAQRAFDLGRPDVVPLLIDTYSPAEPASLKIHQLAQLYTPNPKMAYGLALLYQRLLPDSSTAIADEIIASLEPQLTTEQQAEARQYSDALWPRFADAAGAAQNIAPCSIEP